ncbi:hypothetical protein LUZ60_003058 [Juncus effusus]|nr:hypothetical protein LUZ60_003058 [Juncus effusus]
MSMLDAFFNKGGGGTGFKAAKCKTLLKLTIPRIKLLRNRREIQLKQMRKDIAKLLENGQEATARIRVEHIIREENMMAAQEIIELFCELITVRLPIIDTQRECPLDLKEAISSICFAAPRCADLTELMQVQMLFGAKYGKEFVQAATELLPDCGVNRQIIELLSVRAPSVETKMKLLKEIAEEHGLDWDPTATESEYSKPHEDLLNGPSYTNDASNLNLPKEEKNEERSSEEEKSNPDLNTEDDSFDLDLPEVPKITITPLSSKPPPVHQTGPNIPILPPNNSQQTTQTGPNIPILPPSNSDKREIGPSNNNNIPIPFPNAPPLDSAFNEPKQFIPFISSPSFPTASNESKHVFKSEIKSEIINTKSSQTVQNSNVQTSNLDLQDVLAAAQEAADSADKAAKAARAAADLAQSTINDFVSKNNKNEVKRNDSDERNGEEKRPVFDRQDSNSNPFSNVEMESPVRKDSHVPQRLDSLEDDSYDNYPNLFGSSGSGHFGSDRKN